MTLLTPLRGDLSQLTADLIVHFQMEGERLLPSVTGASLRADLTKVLKLDGFEGKGDASVLWHSNGRHPAARYLVVGVGKKKDFTRETLWRSAAAAGVRATELKARTAGISLLPAQGLAGTEEAARIATGGFLHGCYRFEKYQSSPKGGREPSELIVGIGKTDPRKLAPILEEVRVVDRATRLARDLVSEHPAYLHPEKMREVASLEARKAGLKCAIMEEDEMKRLGMGGMLGVSRGSEHPAVMIHLHHKPRGERKKSRVVLVGKGVTFDTGGISLKQPDGMDAMKADMAGAAAVLSTLLCLPALKIPVEVHGLLMMVENMPDGRAIRPGDILRICNGKTVEIKSTDAEGRLILADGLSWACKNLNPDYLVDLATLTGACMVALGPGCTGVMGNSEPLTGKILQAARDSAERMWPLPLFPEYREHIRSEVADVKNSGIRYGGAVTAGLFLQEFVQPGVAWAHLDIAGPSYFEHAYGYAPKGATGHGVRTLLRWIRALP